MSRCRAVIASGLVGSLALMLTACGPSPADAENGALRNLASSVATMRQVTTDLAEISPSASAAAHSVTHDGTVANYLAKPINSSDNLPAPTFVGAWNASVDGDRFSFDAVLTGQGDAGGGDQSYQTSLFVCVHTTGTWHSGGEARVSNAPCRTDITAVLTIRGSKRTTLNAVQQSSRAADPSRFANH